MLTFQFARLLLISQIPTEMIFPMINEIEFPRNQRPCRRGCSEVRYQREVIKLNPGERLASKRPSRNLTTMSPAKLVVAAWQARMTAHIML